MNRHYLLGPAVLVLTTALFSGSRADDKPQQPAKAANAAAAALIDKLTEVAEVDTGYSPYVSGSAFAPLPGSDRVQVAVLFQKPPKTSDTFRELVKLGPVAVPDLVAHLNDKRPTKINVGTFGSLEINKPDKDDKPDNYTIKVGDLCCVALGQIVNRDYRVVSYFPSAMVFVHTPTRDPNWCDELKKEWGDLTPEKHRKSLLKDCAGKDAKNTRVGAFLRIAWYYPDSLEEPALKFLALPTYDEREVKEFVTKKLYTETDVKKRRELFDAFVMETGVGGRCGIREILYAGLCHLEYIEEKSLKPTDFGDKPRQLLIELYDTPKTVKYEDRPAPESISVNHFVEVIQYGLTYDRRVKIDKAVLDLMTKTTDMTMVRACLERLVGRGFDPEIEASFRRRENEPIHGKQTFKENFLPMAGWTPLHVAVSRGQQERLTELLREGAKVNVAARDGSTPLHLAAEGNTQAVKALLDAGADQRATDKRERTPVSVASFEGHTGIVRQLVAAGGPISDIFVATTVGKTEEVAAFLRKDKELLKAKDSAGFTPLHRATLEGQMKVMQQLVDVGADVNILGEYPMEMSTLDLAAALGRADACALLIKAKAKFDGPGRQPIHYAAMNGHLEVVMLLVERGVKVDSRDGRLCTPLHYAASHTQLAVVKWLVEHKADVNAKDEEGKNVFYYAIVNKDSENPVSEYLAKKGAKYEDPPPPELDK